MIIDLPVVREIYRNVWLPEAVFEVQPVRLDVLGSSDRLREAQEQRSAIEKQLSGRAFPNKASSINFVPAHERGGDSYGAERSMSLSERHSRQGPKDRSGKHHDYSVDSIYLLDQIASF